MGRTTTASAGRRIGAAIALPAIALALGACGSSSPASPKEQYISDLDAVCAKFAKQLSADRRGLRTALAERSGTAVLALALDRTARDLAREYNRLNDFPPPRHDAVELDRMLHAVEAEALITDEYATSVRRPGPSSTGVLSEEIQTDAREARAIARRYGFRVCGATG